MTLSLSSRAAALRLCAPSAYAALLIWAVPPRLVPGYASGQEAPVDATSIEHVGKQFLGSKEFDLAAAEFRKALVMNPASPALHNNLGLALIGQGDLNGALDEFKQAARLDREYGGARSNMGLGLLKLGDGTAARAEVRGGVGRRRSG